MYNKYLNSVRTESWKKDSAFVTKGGYLFSSEFFLEEKKKTGRLLPLFFLDFALCSLCGDIFSRSFKAMFYIFFSVLLISYQPIVAPLVYAK